MCRTGSHQDFYGLGVANVIFGLASMILPDHTAYSSDNFFKIFDSTAADFVSATAAITVITGLFLLVAGILLIIISRRMVENLAYHRLTQAALVFLVLGVFVSPITFALNIVSAVDASDDTFTPPQDAGDNALQTMGFGSDPSNPTNYTISVTNLFQLFMAFDRYADYRYGSSAALTLVAIACFFMDIACAVIICRQYGYKCFGRSAGPPTTPHLSGLVVMGNGDANGSRIQYQNQINDDRAVVIQPLPERLGQGIHGHGNFQDASTPYRNLAVV